MGGIIDQTIIEKQKNRKTEDQKTRRPEDQKTRTLEQQNIRTAEKHNTIKAQQGNSTKKENMNRRTEYYIVLNIITRELGVVAFIFIYDQGCQM